MGGVKVNLIKEKSNNSGNKFDIFTNAPTSNERLQQY